MLKEAGYPQGPTSRVQHRPARLAVAADRGALQPRRRDLWLQQASAGVAGGLREAGRAQLATKRLIDIVGSVVALSLLLWVLLVAALAVKLTSKGPVFYAQQRVGRNGRTFRILKLRSMYVDADERRPECLALNEASGPVFKMRHDPRVTRVGRILRKLSIDELPQLINVLKGDMSLVGPRPPLPSEYATYSAHQRQRLAATPGLTCIWQVSGRSDIGFEDWVRLDLEYIDRWSLLLDLRLLWRTIPAVLTGRGAY